MKETRKRMGGDGSARWRGAATSSITTTTRRHPHRLHHALLAVVLLLVTSASTSEAGQSYRTAYACEGTQLNINCNSGNVIDVIRANYGRFSITICNAHGNTEWSVNCQSPRTRRVLADSCSGKQSCSIEANTARFGDGCPGTFKYLEAHYRCMAATSTTTTTPRPRPPWFTATRPPIRILPTHTTNHTTTAPTTPPPSTTTTTTTTTTTSTTSTTTTTSTTPATVPHVAEGEGSETDDLTTVADGEVPSLGPASVTPASSSPVTPSSSPATTSSTNQAAPVAPPNYGSDYDSPWCPPTFGRGLLWNWTRGGEVAVQACPGGATGSARRRCQMATWEATVDLSECRSLWLATLETRANSRESLLSVATDLAKVTASKALYGGDLITTARLLSTLALNMAKHAHAFPDPRQRQALVTEMLQATLTTGSALLKAGMTGPWGDLGVRERRHAVTQLMVALEEASFLLADVLIAGTQDAMYQSHVLVSARSVPADGSSVEFPSSRDQSLEWVFADSISLPPEAVLENSDGGATRVVFLTYRHLEDLLAPGQEPLGHRSSNVTRLVNSRVLSASLGRGRHIQLPEPVTLTFSLLRQENVTRPVCAFWDYTTSFWSDEGCSVLGYNRSHVTCQCDHLTSFAVLMEEAAGGVGEDPQAALRILAYVGCVVSLVCVAGSLLVFSVFRGLASPRTAVHRHVCVCLTAAELVFMVGVWRTDAPVLCGVVAGILHYSVLAAFAWMFMEGVHVYLSVARAVECDSLRLRWWHYSLAYGLPLLVVAVAAVVDPFSYGTEQYCWLRTDNYFVFSLVGPALLLLAAHVALLAAALIYTCRLSPDDALKTKEMARLDSTSGVYTNALQHRLYSRLAWLRGAITLLLLMVLTWTLGLLFLHRPSLPIAAAFCVLNALHGIFIFIYYCVRNQKVREWCRSAAEREAWLPQAVRGVFAAEKQTYSPNNTTTTTSSNNNPHHHHHHLHHHHHHPAISHALNHALASSPALNQYLPTLCQLGGVKGPGGSTHPPAGPLLSGATSTMGSGGSLRQGATGHLPLGTLHQSLPRHHHHPVTLPHTTTTTTTTSPHPGTLNQEDKEGTYKNSFSKDSGHGTYEQEDSPRSGWNNHHNHHNHHGHHRYSNSLTADLKNAYLAKLNSINASAGLDGGLTFPSMEGGNKQISVPNSYTTQLSPAQVPPAMAAVLRGNGNTARSHSPWNHTYMEIETEADPVYEEIERERWAGRSAGLGVPPAGQEAMQVSDLSDEDVKRGTPSDVSRQSSRSYGDARPLLPYHHHSSPGHHYPKSPQDAQFALSEERLRDFNAAQMSRDLEQLQQAHQQFSRENLMTVAVLNGEQVVCRLTSPSNPQAPQSLPVIHEGGGRGMVVTQANSSANGYPAHLVVSRPSHYNPQQFSEC
ncbi:latrophilin Cirl-like isoform X3 [Portunus trituberculatus]|uniref:latrophilin Cirl-like isoform X3 n=1 Tax=Portunus trituberculatus TaxID=210409 RepID=UPI001E1CE0DD|nr:latrophilin Cirl-like isoform X3 [Portunus trituberculatus]